MWRIGLIQLGCLVGVMGCVTTTLPDGTVVERMDPAVFSLVERSVDRLLTELEEEGAASVPREETGLEGWVALLLDANEDGVISLDELRAQASELRSVKREE